MAGSISVTHDKHGNVILRLYEDIRRADTYIEVRMPPQDVDQIVRDLMQSKMWAEASR